MMSFQCVQLLWFLGAVVAQDLFEKESRFLAQHGLSVQTVNPNETSLTAQVAVASADSWYKTITPSGNTGLCLDAPGGSAWNGNMLWLWECNGQDGQIWVFDDYQIRFGADENYCIDARDMSDGVRLMLWECTGGDNQKWGYDDSASRVYIEDTSTCLDLYEDQQWNGQWLHVWECNGLGNQEWGIWDSGAPHGPAPSPPTPGGSGQFCWDAVGDWPMFQSQSDLQNDPWGNYFQAVYGEVPSDNYPICIGSLRLIYLTAAQNAGVSLPSVGGSCPSSKSGTGELFKFGQSLWSGGGGMDYNAVNIWHGAGNRQELPSNIWAEITHTKTKQETSGAWYYYMQGSGVWFWMGSTWSSAEHKEAAQHFLGSSSGCKGNECDNLMPQISSEACKSGVDSIQFL